MFFFRPSTGIPVLHSGSHFRHGLLQLMIHTIDPLHDGSSNFGSYFLTRIEWLCFINHHYHLFTQLTDDSWINSSYLISFRKKRKIPPLAEFYLYSLVFLIFMAEFFISEDTQKLYFKFIISNEFSYFTCILRLRNICIWNVYLILHNLQKIRQFSLWVRF